MRSTKYVIAALALGPFATSAAQTDENRDQANQDRAMQNEAQQRMNGGDRREQHAQMRREAVSANDILRGNISNGLNTYGEVQNLVLNTEGTAVEYVVVNSEDSVLTSMWDHGFLPYSAVDLQAVNGWHGIDLVTEEDLSEGGKQELTITRDEAEHRLVSRITDSRLEIGDGESFQIEDILIHPETGEIRHYVVGTDPDAVFSQERQTVPADKVQFSRGEFRTELSAQEIRDNQEYHASLL